MKPALEVLYSTPRTAVWNNTDHTHTSPPLSVPASDTQKEDEPVDCGGSEQL